jgi:hypothetical protein
MFIGNREFSGVGEHLLVVRQEIGKEWSERSIRRRIRLALWLEAAPRHLYTWRRRVEIQFNDGKSRSRNET